jgi:hypothetical protein
LAREPSSNAHATSHLLPYPWVGLRSRSESWIMILAEGSRWVEDPHRSPLLRSINYHPLLDLILLVFQWSEHQMLRTKGYTPSSNCKYWLVSLTTQRY